MVANDPVERPGSPDFIKNELTALRRDLDALTRQSKYPFSISHDGTPDFEVLPDPADPGGGAKVRILNGAGAPIFETFYSTTYSGKAARMLDLSGASMWAQDQLAGYGISHPSLTGWLAPDFYGQGLNPFGTGAETSVATGQFFAYNPAWRLGALVRTGGTGLVSWRFSIAYNGGTVYGPLTTGATGNFYIGSTLLLPASAMANQVTASLLVTNTSAAQTIQVSPTRCYGVSAAQYYIDNGLPLPF
ncbi:hypothetical protein [Amycolatopsis sp. VC5-11]|uniref:hypothetical protein n=1 Tax=Amycolatopsis sp. VC5-11 TaxID=3120156 RepID=UPI00300AB35D